MIHAFARWYWAAIIAACAVVHVVASVMHGDLSRGALWAFNALTFGALAVIRFCRRDEIEQNIADCRRTDKARRARKIL